ncbi:MAG: hypothetical protein BWY26_00143 [Elusimicrobia bacterium ADurb.Bin231]|nr:MAG: hypothetical protein BWY26_00143 [Elusimicrobia bacterium ADurb.Bin231]
MKKLKCSFIMFLAVVLFSGLTCVSGVSAVQLSDKEILSLVDLTINNLPDRMVDIPPEIRRVAFISMKADRSVVSVPLAKQIQGKIEAKAASAGKITMVYAPEVKPIKVSASEGVITLSSGFQTSDEIKQLGEKLRLDGLMEGEMYFTSDTLYMNVRIFDARNMAIVWSHELSSVIPVPPPPPPPPPPLPVKKYTGIDYGFGIAGLQLRDIPGVTGVDVPDFAKYYCLDARISEKTIFTDKVRFTLAGGLLSLFSGLKSGDVAGTHVSVDNTSVSGRVLATVFARIGVRISLIPRKLSDEKIANPFTKPRDILASEVSVGKIWVRGTSGLETLGIRFESDITRVLSVAAGFSYVTSEDTVIASSAAGNRKVTVGGMYYEISLLRFNFMP